MGEVAVVNPEGLRAVIAALERRAPDEPIDAAAWLNADYSPLPSLVSAARRIFEHEPLPQIKTAQSAGIPDTIATSVAAANQARENRELHLALVTGVPGSGKTLVGLQFVYENHFGDTGSKRSAVFLSGNGPLVEVLQYALKSKVFVQDVHGFLKQYGGSAAARRRSTSGSTTRPSGLGTPQRVREKRGHDRSEPEDFLRIGSRKRLLGADGGPDRRGAGDLPGRRGRARPVERGDPKDIRPWTVHCPRKIADIFAAAERLDISESLDLDISLRTHLAEDVQGLGAGPARWTPRRGRGSCGGHEEAGLPPLSDTRLERATSYVRERYRTEEDKRYGFLGSSKGKLDPFGIHTDYYATQRMKIGPWYYDHPTPWARAANSTRLPPSSSARGSNWTYPSWAGVWIWTGVEGVGRARRSGGRRRAIRIS